ncbi:MAG: 30S ribosomal protein S2 [Collinsella sp.]
MVTKINDPAPARGWLRHFSATRPRRWNPQDEAVHLGERNNIYILDLKQTIVEADKAYTFLERPLPRVARSSSSAPRSRLRRP